MACGAGKERRPIIEFAIENVNILQKRQLRQKMTDSAPPAERRYVQKPATERPQVSMSAIVWLSDVINGNTMRQGLPVQATDRQAAVRGRGTPQAAKAAPAKPERQAHEVRPQES